MYEWINDCASSEKGKRKNLVIVRDLIVIRGDPRDSEDSLFFDEWQGALRKGTFGEGVKRRRHLIDIFVTFSARLESSARHLFV